MNRFFKNIKCLSISILVILFQLWGTQLNASVLNETTPFTVEVVTTQIECAEVCDGSALAVVTGGTPPFTFLWNNGDTRQHLDWEPAGFYEVTVTDADGHSATASGTISEPPPIVIDLDINYQGGSCAAGLTEVTANATGGTPGTPDYTYEWSTGAWGATVCLSPGSYWITVTDGNGCKKGRNFAVAACGLQVDVNVDPGQCGANNATATAIVTGATGAIDYNLQPGNIRMQTVTGLAPGRYTFFARDAIGCKGEKDFEIPDGNLDVDASGTNPTCDGNGMDGSVIGTLITPGTPPYDIKWKNASGTVVGTNWQVNNLSAGTYTLEVSDAGGCFDSDVVTLTQSQAPDIQVNIGHLTCFGYSDGFVEATIGGGNYTFIWKDSGGNTIGNQLRVNDLPAGSYTIVVDAGSCSDSSTVTLINPADIILNTSSTPSACLMSTGTATVSASGGTPGYTYLWCNGQTSATATGLPAGNCSVVVTDSKGCFKETVVTIADSSDLAVTIDPKNASCNADDGMATANVIGGTAGYSYLWSNGEMTPMINNLAPGDYSLTVTDALGCKAFASTKIEQDSNLIVVIVPNSTDCDTAPTSATATVSSGTPAFDYAWSDGQATETAINLTPGGTYSVTVTDMNGCMGADTITLDTTAYSADFDWTFEECYDNDSIRVQFNNLSTPGQTTCLWKFGTGQISVEANPIVVLTEDTIQVTLIKTWGNCIDSITKEVVLPLVHVTIANGSACQGDSLLITANKTGAASVSYDWFPDTLILDGDATPTVSVNTAIVDTFQIYAVVTSDLGCMDTICVSYTVDSLKTIDPDSLLCRQCDSLTIDFGGISDVKWIFDINDSTAVSTDDNPSYTYPDTGTYKVLIIPNDPCIDTICKTVTVEPMSLDFECDLTECIDTCKLLLTDISIVPGMITSWEWTVADSSGQIVQTATGSSAMFDIPETGTYTVTLRIEFGDGCIQEITKTKTMTCDPKPEDLSLRVCLGDTTKFLLPGVPGTIFTGAQDTMFTVDTLGNGCFIGWVPGIYEYCVIVTNNNCIDTIKIQGICFSNPMVEIVGDTIVCDSSIVVLDAVSADSNDYKWALDINFDSIIGTNDTLLVQPGRPTTYYVMVTDQNGCTAMDEHTVGNYQVDIEIMGDPIICIGDSTRLTLANGNLGDTLDIIWSPLDIILSGQGTSSVTVMPIDDAVVTVETTNQFGCMATDSFTIQVNNANEDLEIDVILNENDEPKTSIYAFNDSTQLFATEGYATYSWEPANFTFTPDISNPIVIPNLTTVYQVTVTDDEGCIGTDTITIRVLPTICERPEVFLPNVFTPNGDDLNDVLLVRGKIIDEFHILIYDRWGKLVFESKDRDIGWNGKWRNTGEDVGPDVYGYCMTIKCLGGEEFVESGNITILK